MCVVIISTTVCLAEDLFRRLPLSWQREPKIIQFLAQEAHGYSWDNTTSMLAARKVSVRRKTDYVGSVALKSDQQ